MDADAICSLPSRALDSGLRLFFLDDCMRYELSLEAFALTRFHALSILSNTDVSV